MVAANTPRFGTVETVAARLGASVAKFSLARPIAKGVIPIPGTRYIAHLEANWATHTLALGAETLAELDTAFPPVTTTGERWPPGLVASVGVPYQAPA